MEQQLAVVKPQVTPDQVALLKKTVAKDATDDELKLFFYDCERRGVHPLDKLIHFTKRKGKYTPITSIDFMRIRAEETGKYAGSDDPAFEDLPAPAKNPAKATVTVWKMVEGVRCPFVATARWGEYAPSDMSSDSAFMWRKMPYTMLGKCAEALALRKAFPGQLQGLYAKEEMDQANSESKMAPEQARAFVNETMAKLPPASAPEPITTQEEKPAQPYEEFENEARFTLSSVEKKTGRNGEYRKVTWPEGSGNCFEVAEFATLDELQNGSVVTAEIMRKGQYVNILRIKSVASSQEDWDAGLYVQEDEYAAG